VAGIPRILYLSSGGEAAVMGSAREPVARGEGGNVMPNKAERARAAARELADIPAQLVALERMSVAELAEKYRELYSEPTRSRNKAYLRKRLAWRIQELAEGGLPQRALAKIAELGDELPERWRMRQAALQPTLPAEPGLQRDPRLPPPGTVLTRLYQGVEHRVTVREQDFEYQGESYKTLSRLARRITGTPWNGFLFFGLQKSGGQGGEP
jgi:hypothetical protein